MTYGNDACDTLRKGVDHLRNNDSVCELADTTVTQRCSLDVPELRRHLKMRHMTAAPVLRPFLSNLEQQLKSWDAGGNREHLRPAIERTILQIEAARQ